MTPREYVEKNWKKKTVPMMARDSGFTKWQIIYACESLGIEPISERDLKTAVVLDNYEKLSGQEICKLFNISWSTLKDICKDYGIECLSPAESRRLQEKQTTKAEVRKLSFWDRIRLYEREEWKREHINRDIDFSLLD